MKALFGTIIFLLPLTSAFSQAPVPISWEHTSGPYGGVIYSMVDNGDGNLYVATEGDGIFRSSDNGENWVEVNNGLTNPIVYCLAVNQNGEVFAGTEGSGIFRLRIGDTTWVAINTGLITQNDPSAIVNSIAVNDSGHVFAAVLFRGAYRSTDNGATWTEINSGLTDLNTIAIAVSDNNEVLVSAFDGGIFKSADNGATWQYLALENERLYAILPLPNGQIFAGRWRSTDNGVNWFPTESPGTTFWSFLHTTSGEVYSTTNAGVFRYFSSLWVPVPTNSNLPRMTTFTVIQRATGDIFAGSGGMGVYKLQGNTEWVPKTRGITNIDIRAITRGIGNDVYASSYFSGIFRSTDNGATWTRTKVDVNLLRSVCITVTPSGTLLAGTWRIIDDIKGGNVFRSTDNGETWVNVLGTIAGTDVQSLTVSPTGTVFAGTIGDNLFKSTDDGITWSPVSTAPYQPIFFSLASDNDGDIFGGTLASGLLRSTDGGANWTSLLNSGLPLENNNRNTFPYIRSLAFASTGEIFAATYGKGVYRSLNNGDNWLATNAGLNQFGQYVLSLTINNRDDVFAGTEDGVFRMINQSENWSRVVNGLGNTYVRSVVVTASGHVLAGTWGSGIFRTVNPTGVQQPPPEVPQNFSLEQNYPNPFNPITTIRFQVTMPGLVSLKVYDILGKEVATVLSKELSPGLFTVPWDASTLPSGVYFYRIQAGSFTDVKRAILLK